MNNKAVIQIVAIVIAIGAAFAAFNVLSTWGSRPAVPSGLVKVGEIQSVEGQVERRLAKTVNVDAVSSAQPLYGQDLVLTQKSSNAVLSLNTGTSVKLAENTRFIVELDATRPGAMIGTILDGDVAVLSPGSQGSFRLYREGREVPLDRAADPSKAPVVVPAAPTGAAANADFQEGVTVTATLPDESATPAPRAAPAAPTDDGANNPSNDVLTNEDIIRQLRAQTGFFQRCYLNYIHRMQSQSTAAATNKITSGGTVVVGFVVQPTGRVAEAKISRSDFKDTILNNCLTEVIERTRFKGFRGEKPVPVLEFPISLQ